MRRFIIILSIFLTSLVSVYAQNVSFTASAPKVVRNNEQFNITFTVNAKGTNFTPPKIENFQILFGPSAASSSSMQIINGQITQSSNYSYTYRLLPRKEGKFSIGSAKIKVNGKSYKTNPLKIEVVKGNTPSNNAQSAANQKSQNVSGEELFIKLSVSKTNTYQGEHLIATLKIYSRVNLAGFEDIKLPSFDGFWAQEIQTDDQISLARENVNGRIYEAGVIKKYVLFPQRSGNIVIEPAKIDCIVRKKVNNRRSFFGVSYTNVSAKIKSRPVTIKVKPLPANKPAEFKGAVGNFKFIANIDKNEVDNNDAITLKLKVSGNGNLKLLDIPELNIPHDIEMYDPIVKNNIKYTTNGSSGSKTFEYLLIPRHPGDFTLPAVNFSYFDTKSKKYKTISSEEFKIKVNKGEDDETSGVIKSISKEDVKYINTDIRHIKTDIKDIREKENDFYKSILYVLSYILSLILFALVLVLRRKHIKYKSDTALVKNKKANKIVKKRLNEASKYLASGNKAEFYDEVLKALWGYLSDKLRIPVSDLSKETVSETMTGFNVGQDIIDEFVDLLNNCEFAQFAPGNEQGKMDNIYSGTVSVISKLENKLK